MRTKSERKASKAFSNPIYRPILQLALVITLVFLVAIVALVWSSWRNVQRIEPIHFHLKFLSQLQQLDVHFQEYQKKRTDTPDALPRIQLELLNDIEQLINSTNVPELSTINKLKKMKQNIADNHQLDAETFENYRTQTQVAVSDEIKLHNAFLSDMSHSTKFEFYLALIMTLIFTFGLILFLFFFRNQILLPLHNLNGFITLLAEQEYKTMPMDNIEPLLQPLFLNYNHMVSRLAELEQENANRRKTLEKNIRSATDVLVEQQRSLARSERLAIIGEFVASIAHELRNPLAGVQMALLNLRQDVETESQQQRLDLIINELARTSRILNDVLKQARHAPEQAVQFNMKDMVSNLVTLARYQLPSGIELSYDVQVDDVSCLPQEGLRQALLNLIVNASQAIVKGDGKICIKVRRQAKSIEISVQDNGPGFPEQMLHSAIQPFVTWKKNGTGLGMAMVRRYIQNLSGELKLENIKPHGALVSLKLPCEKS